MDLIGKTFALALIIFIAAYGFSLFLEAIKEK